MIGFSYKKNLYEDDIRSRNMTEAVKMEKALQIRKEDCLKSLPGRKK